MAAKIRNALTLYRPLRAVENMEIRLHRTVLYNSIYRADDQLMVNQHIWRPSRAGTGVLPARRG